MHVCLTPQNVAVLLQTVKQFNRPQYFMPRVYVRNFFRGKTMEKLLFWSTGRRTLSKLQSRNNRRLGQRVPRDPRKTSKSLEAEQKFQSGNLHVFAQFAVDDRFLRSKHVGERSRVGGDLASAAMTNKIAEIAENLVIAIPRWTKRALV